MASHIPRFTKAYAVREQAALMAKSRPHPLHVSNNEELRYRIPTSGEPSHIGSYTKGLPHDRNTGVLSNPDDFQSFIRAMDAGDQFSIRDVPLGPQNEQQAFQSGIAKGVSARAWESMAAGLTYDLEGPDAQSVTMPPAPALDSDELLTEVTELYWMALLRDVPFSEFNGDKNNDIQEAVDSLNSTPWVQIAKNGVVPTTLTDAERVRLRGPFTVDNVFRGTTRGDRDGPYLSQFMLIGNTGIGNGNRIEDGFIRYGAHRVDQRVRVAEMGRDFMTTWSAFVDVQNGADVRGREVYNNDVRYRFISTPRDLATYVHFDALYQAYLNACLILLGMRVPFDKGLPFQREDDIDHQQTFATFGAPHILSLVTEVATRALKAVRFQKFNVHRRLRPEAVGGLLHRYMQETTNDLYRGAKQLAENLDANLLDKVKRHNAKQNMKSDGDAPRANDLGECEDADEITLLPMAFPEGSPMHPSYGAGHATVAGACVTILKAFFDHGYELRMLDEDGETMIPFAFVPTADGSGLENRIGEYRNLTALTVEGELNKVCSNICIGRNWGGVHYFSDYRESIRVGEQVAIGLLEEQKLTYGENFSMTVPLFDGSVHRI
uniref:Vanadium-dependent bromoperoxidase 1 n=1 Tax=Gracilaria firma TaxID=2510791 RepID=L7YCT6_9FLOR|nr:vanadium-dependent bromoperoxidase 1 [Gracilaria changii]AGE00856.1 vanadium-dependent bromoperoxidase 1 [Gracilaria changii]